MIDHPRHTFVHGDIADPASRRRSSKASDIVVHFAAETHVDRSIMSAGEFITTDVYGTFVLLEAAREAPGLRRFVQISTDEVYGSVPEGASRETDELRPRNPYSASKAGADRLAYSYWATYGVPVDHHARVEQLRTRISFPRKSSRSSSRTPSTTSRCRSTATAATNATGCTSPTIAARSTSLIERGADGEVYNIGGGNEVQEHRSHAPHPANWSASPTSLIRPVADRPGHDRRYCARHDQAAGARLAPAGAVRRRARAKRSRGTGRTSGGGGRSRKRTRASARSTTPSTANAASDRLPCLVLLWSPAPPVSPAATSSINSWRKSRRLPRGRITADGRRRHCDDPGSAGARWTCSIAAPSPSLVGAAAVGRLSLRRHRPCRRILVGAGARAERQRLGTHHVLEASADAGLDCPVLVTVPRSSTAHQPTRSGKTIRSDLPIPTVSASSRRRCSRSGRPRAGLHRAAVQPCRTAAVAGVRDVQLSRGRSRKSKPDAASRCCASATWNPAATSPTSATPFARTGSSSSMDDHAGPTTSAPAMPTVCATCSTRSSACRRRRSKSAWIPRGCGPVIIRSSPAIDRASAPRRAGRRRFRSSDPRRSAELLAPGDPGVVMISKRLFRRTAVNSCTSRWERSPCCCVI